MGRGFRVNMRVPEIQIALDNLSAYDGKSRMRVEHAVQSSTKNIAQGAKQRVPVRSGALKKSITSNFSSQKVEGIVRAKEPYAHLIEFGHKGAVITPRSKRALNLGGGHFAEKVQTPNVAERPFMRPAFEDEKPGLIRELAKAVQP